jgi:hypothetical protein
LDELHVGEMPVHGVRDAHRVVPRTIVDDDYFDLLGVHCLENRSQSLEARRETQ